MTVRSVPTGGYCEDRDCGPICDFCQWYRFNGNEHGVYIGNGRCEHPGHPRPSEPHDGCEDYLCADWPEADPALREAHLAANRAAPQPPLARDDRAGPATAAAPGTTGSRGRIADPAPLARDPEEERATPPAPDPCLVSLQKGTGGGSISEKAWRRARNCPRGCGSVCALARDPEWPAQEC